jgi:putative transposase
MYYERNLPHWQPEGRQIFLTWRLQGSLPQQLLLQLRADGNKTGRQFARADRFLDGAAHGPLWLREENIARLVQASILRGARVLRQFELLAYVVMPNHVHLLIEPVVPLARITCGIKGATSMRANAALKRTGQAFWQAESFDHWVRSPTESEPIREYIEQNPVKAGLVSSPDRWRWSSAARK